MTAVKIHHYFIYGVIDEDPAKLVEPAVFCRHAGTVEQQAV
jgi:hypothetical protein